MRAVELRENLRVGFEDADGPIVSDSNSVSDLVGNAWSQNVSFIALPVSRLDPEFFDLSSRIAGDVLQKLVNYGLKLAIIGDISRHLESSGALRDFVWESNRGEHVWFLADEGEFESKLRDRFGA